MIEEERGVLSAWVLHFRSGFCITACSTQEELKNINLQFEKIM